jgi:uncharacterized protein (PEP-CTERM system associated)
MKCSIVDDATKKLISTALLAIAAATCKVEASSVLTPILTVKEFLTSFESSGIDESGQITSIAPGFDYQFEHSRSTLNINYLYNIDHFSGLETDDRKSNQLDLRYQFSHIPDQWVSQITGNIRQTTSDANTLESLNRLLDSGETTELRTYSFNTSLNKKILGGINSSIRMDLNHADYKGQDNSESLGLDFILDNQQSRKKLFWNARINYTGNTNGNTNTDISFLELGLNYVFNRKFTGYVQGKSYDTTDELTTYSSTLLGLRFQPGLQSFIDLAIGKRGTENSYSLDSQFTKRRISLSVNYNEIVTSARNETINQETTDTGITSVTRSLSIDPILQKKGSITLSLQGRRSEISLKYLKQNQSSPTTAIDDRAELIIPSFLRH